MGNSPAPLPSLFITLEGGEGSGKSTLLCALSRELERRGYEVVATREPGGSLLGEKLRTLLLDLHEEKVPIEPRAELLLFLAARWQHLQERILPALQRGAIVLCDRFQDSTLAYQGYARNGNLLDVEPLCSLACPFLPHLTLLIDLDPEVGLRRGSIHARPDRIESEGVAFHRRVREGFLALARREPGRFVLLDGTLSPNEVAERALEVIAKKLPPNLRS